MRATLLLHTKEIKGDEIVEIKIWQVPKTADKPDGVKLSLVYIKGKKRLIGYDNAEGKGYHRHLLDKVEPYRFIDIWELLDDFKKDLEKLRRRYWDEG